MSKIKYLGAESIQVLVDKIKKTQQSLSTLDEKVNTTITLKLDSNGYVSCSKSSGQEGFGVDQGFLYII